MKRKLGWPFTLCVLLFAAYAVLRQTRPGLIASDQYPYLLAACLAALSVAAVRAVNFFRFDLVFRRRKKREAPALLRVLLSLVLYSVAVVLILSLVLHRNLSGFLTTSAVLSVIFGLALQDTLGNFFAGISLHVEQPFHIGDVIRIDGKLGRVEAVTWRTTSIRTEDNTVVIFPNNMVARDPPEVYARTQLNRRVLLVPAPYGVPPETVKATIRDALRGLPHMASEVPPTIRVEQFAESSILYEVVYWVKDYLWGFELDAQIRERVWYAFHRGGIRIPFPTRHLLTDAPDAHRPEPPDYRRLLAGIDLFEPLTDEEKARLADTFVHLLYAPGEMILRRGDPGESMFIIQRGTAEVRLAGRTAAEGIHRITVLGPGDSFGEMALFTGEPRAADVLAVEEVELLEIRKPTIERLLAENGGLAECFSRTIAERQENLARHALVAALEPERALAPETMLWRIRRFFNLA